MIKEDIEIIINDTAIVVVVKEGKTRGQLLERISLDNLERETIIFDFESTIHLTSAFITDLIAIHETCLAKEYKMLVCGTNKLVTDIFSSIGLMQLFKFSK